MNFLSVNFYNFRNLDNKKINTNAKDIFLIGENAQGKTNFLESIYLLCYGSSFRNKKSFNFIKHDFKELSIKADLEDKDNLFKTNLILKVRNKKKEILFNNKKIFDRKELIKNFPCIIFSHEDIHYVSGSPDKKRLFINQTMSLNNPIFVDTLRKYNKLIKMRNILLKNGKYKEIDVYDELIAKEGLYIKELRTKLFISFNEIFNNIFKGISGLKDDIKIKYISSWKNAKTEKEILEILKSKRERDIYFKNTTSGPHRDDFKYIINDKRDFSLEASTGQKRLLSLVLKISQAVFFYKITSKKPILLIDDVLLELDLKKRERFFNYMPEYSQAFFTFLPDEKYSNFKKNNTILYSVENGNLYLQ